MATIYCRIYGRVQMVMYRDYATRKARSLGLVGYVRNLTDGSVEIFAEGTKEALETYVEKLHRGSILSRVERVDVAWDARVPEDMHGTSFDSFDIVY